MAMDDLFSGLTDEQKQRAKACKSPEELAALAKEEGLELTDDQLAAISGGADWNGCWNECGKDYCANVYPYCYKVYNGNCVQVSVVCEVVYHED